jgi:hypothetical protein
MMMYNFDGPGPTGSILNREILDSITHLNSLINDLDAYGYQLIAFNKEGIIVEHKDYVDTATLESRITDLQGKINTHGNLISSLEGFAYPLNDNINDLYNKYDALVKKDKPPGEEITEEFFIFAEMLPEHIKKELKIFIKKQ